MAGSKHLHVILEAVIKTPFEYSFRENLTPGGYHIGLTKDLTQLVEIVHKKYPEKGKRTDVNCATV